MEWIEHTVVRDGVRLRCLDSGGVGLPLVLLHAAGHAGEWDTPARLLRSRHRVVAIDQRGHGGSERTPGDVSRAAYVEDVATVVERLALGKVTLIGQSLGGHTAMPPPQRTRNSSVRWYSSKPAPVTRIRRAPYGSGSGSTPGRRRSDRTRRRWPSSVTARSAGAGRTDWKGEPTVFGPASTGM